MALGRPQKYQYMEINIKKTLMNNFVNIFVIQFGFLHIETLLNGVQVETDQMFFPSKTENFLSILILLFFHDFCFYFIHRFQHQKPIYQYIHKIHHQYYQNVCIAGQYFHPIDYIITILAPTYIMFKFLKKNCIQLAFVCGFLS
ncbi:protein kinase domain protein aurora kinase [Ichthyophthirius multifiliis]|uniref:Protein kinase domain protein aurora kinase n=1 Tax=Ichthyophthirius multifiliis TaxID=5932 RepID=G0R240_ICHMU|nr:protein kinase domain protein aurora kinase [Ichthyophthirius multifiliis]EGR28468.1 protein kinase domain protein aurora kinase [Ichthyophthirius multifiliis]|eukprot:XP_004029704.1 protein kinase domain protein aurora kinase [Ichthyophthirius multifiliis]